MELMQTVKEFTETTDKVMEKCKKKLGETMFDEFCDADEEDIEMIGLMADMFHLCDVSLKLVSKQAETIQEINEKMDKLLARS